MRRPKAPFDLEQAISTWKRSLTHYRAFLDDDIDELESHLRDHTAGLMAEGKGQEEAYRMAHAALGELDQMERAYKGVFWRKLKHRRLLVANASYHLSMFRNYATIGLRSLLRHRGYSTVNISGLALGLACAFLVVLWIQSERSVDQFHDNGDNLYSVRINSAGPTGTTTWSNVPFPLAETFENDFPEVERAIITLPITTSLAVDDHSGREKGYFAGPGFFEAFTFPFAVGDPSTALLTPDAVVISEDAASRYFGADWEMKGRIIGQSISLSAWQSDGGVLGQAVAVDTRRELTVTGVFRMIPHRSTLQFDVILPADRVVADFGHVAGWGPRWFDLTVQTKRNTNQAAFGRKIASVIADHVAESGHDTVFVQAFREAYLHSGFEQGVQTGGRIRQVYLIGLVGLAILLMACINFANLVTARAGQRAREIGVRKAVGASPSYLVQQFLSEALLTTLVAFAGAVVITVLLLPVFNAITGVGIRLVDLAPTTWLTFLGVALFTGCIAGSYPALYLASLNPVRVLRSQAITRKKGEVGLRKGLVMLQFGISALLVVGTLTVYQQLVFLQTKDLGMDKENVVLMRLEGDVSTQFASVRQTLLQSPAFEAIARSSEDPVSVAIKNAQLVWEGKEADETIVFTVLRTDDQIADALKLQMADGRFFDEQRDVGTLRFVVNQAAVEAMGLADPVGHPFAFGYDLDQEPSTGSAFGEIVGVVEDFHTGSLSDETIAPLVFRYEPEGAGYLVARVARGQAREALQALEEVQSTLNPGLVFEYSFLDETYQSYYEDEVVLGTLSRLFAFVALFIACLGLLGLSAFSVQQRTKEIGVRRVLGATKAHVLFVLSREFMVVVGTALVIALPLAYWGMTYWLSSFAYRIELGLGTIALAAAASLVLALVAVGYQAQRAIRMGPANSLRSE